MTTVAGILLPEEKKIYRKYCLMDSQQKICSGAGDFRWLVEVAGEGRIGRSIYSV
jgi:hypothetical protein